MMKNSPSIPGWAAGAAIALVAVVAVLLFMRIGGGEGPRDPSTYPKQAFTPPNYAPPAGTYTRDGKPVGAPGQATSNRPGPPGYPTRPN